MAAKNDVTGDLIKSKVGEQNKYADGWEKIFGNKVQKKHDEEQLNDSSIGDTGIVDAD